MTPEQKRAEEEKRNRQMSALQRWQMLQDAINWAFQHPAVRERYSPRGRKAEEACKLAWYRAR